jgi:NAD-dependent deacetylase
VLEFYNQRRAQLAEVVPNQGHTILKDFEKYFDVTIITQNVDNLHERAGSNDIIHLHGELTKARSSVSASMVYDIGTKPIKLG